MQKGFWSNLASPIVGLSPMDGVTDASMRFVAKKYGQPDIIYTEFVSAEGLWRIKKRGDLEHKIWNELKYSEIERPVIAQIFGSEPESFYEAAKIVCELGFDGIDINMGCPSPGLEKRGGGAGLIRDKCNAVEVVEATRRGVADWQKTQKNENSINQNEEIPVSLKTRIGSDKPDPKWWEVIAGMQMPAVAMHGRTFKQLYSGEADWEVLLQAAEVIRASGAKFLGNGDVAQMSVRTAPKPYSVPASGVRLRAVLASASVPTEFTIKTKLGREIDLTGKMDGVLIGREATGNPWVLRKDGYVPTVKEKLAVAVEQAKKYEELFNAEYDEKHFQFFPMRKHLACFVRGFEGSVGLRKDLMRAENAEQVEIMVSDFLENLPTI